MDNQLGGELKQKLFLYVTFKLLTRNVCEDTFIQLLMNDLT